jgi:hypothetical protein
MIPIDLHRPLREILTICPLASAASDDADEPLVPHRQRSALVD